jgi:hypothetical protein
LVVDGLGGKMVAGRYLNVFADLDGTHFESVLSLDGDWRLISFNFMIEWLKKEQVQISLRRRAAEKSWGFPRVKDAEVASRITDALGGQGENTDTYTLRYSDTVYVKYRLLDSEVSIYTGPVQRPQTIKQINTQKHNTRV